MTSLLINGAIGGVGVVIVVVVIHRLLPGATPASARRLVGGVVESVSQLVDLREARGLSQQALTTQPQKRSKHHLPTIVSYAAGVFLSTVQQQLQYHFTADLH